MPKEKAVKNVKESLKLSTSRDLVPVGSKHISAKHHNRPGQLENGERPSTTRALILRNGKHGPVGTGELMAVNRISGREKLDLLAGE
jgi:hypothetical protein